LLSLGAESLLSNNLKIKVYRTRNLPLVLDGCETWSLTLRDHVSHRVRVFENRVLRRIFGPNKDEVTGYWRKLHKEDLNDSVLTQYCSGDNIEKNVMVGACSAFGGQERRI
jgi:hypothetical protein